MSLADTFYLSAQAADVYYTNMLICFFNAPFQDICIDLKIYKLNIQFTKWPQDSH